MRLRVMTFNIKADGMFGRNRWSRRRHAVIETIRRSGAGLIGLQEVRPAQLRDLLRALPGFETVTGDRYGGMYAPIVFDASRLRSARAGSFGLPRGRVCTWSAFEGFSAFNTHLHPRDAVARVESAKLIVSRLPDVPTILTGDLNTNERSDVLAVLRAAGLHDTIEASADTFHGFTGRGVRSLGKIDHILCDDRWRVDGAAVVRDAVEGRFGSDHFALTADLELVPETRL